jgi:hypothetical protein
MTRDELAKLYELFRFRPIGLGSFASATMHEEVFTRLARLSDAPMTKVELNQLLVLSHAGSMSDGFFRYYWGSTPVHPYKVERVPFFPGEPLSDSVVMSHDHLRWGLYRLYTDALLFFGNIDAAYEALRSQNYASLASFFALKRFDTDAIARRGPPLALQQIPKDDRYLISEMVCKTFGDLPADKEEARRLLLEGLKKHAGQPVTLRQLLEGVAQPATKDQLLLSFDDLLDARVADESDVNRSFDAQFDKFFSARQMATRNTDLYLSMVNDLDVYVATSMRNRQNFRDMATTCERIFHDPKLTPFHLRYFDPTMSAARGHEDKGLIECLMVKCAKIVVYTEGEKESYGKDAEAAMSLSLGKPVIFYCDKGVKTRFYRDVHPLARLIDFRSGVAVGAIVSDSVEEVTELVRRIFQNEMEYELKHHDSRPGYLKLHERITDSVVRLQTDDSLLTSAFWNNYHNRRAEGGRSLASGKEAERLHE